MKKFASSPFAKKIEDFRAMILPSSLPVGRELLTSLGSAIQHSLIGMWLMVGGLIRIGEGNSNAPWVYAVCGACLLLHYLNLHHVGRLAAIEPALGDIRRTFALNLLFCAALALLVAAIPWLLGRSLSTYVELMLQLLLGAYCALFAIAHGSAPWSVFVFALINSISLTVFWMTSAFEFKWELVCLTLVFFWLMMRTTFSAGLMTRRSLRLQTERDAARQQAENAARGLKKALLDLKHADSEKLRLFAAANHDLRQPISAISLFVGVLHRKLRHKLGEDQEVEELLNMLDRNIQTLDVIVSSLSEITALERGGATIKPCVFELRPLINDVVREFQGQAESLNTPLRVQLPVLDMFTDPAMLARIVRNVLDNALKYAPGGEILVSVLTHAGATSNSVQDSMQDGRMMLSIRDHGPGIPAAMRGHVFDEYIQVGNPARDRKKGYGLGLSIVRRLADALGTKIELRSAEGGGLDFLIDLSPMVSTLGLDSEGFEPAASPDNLRARYLNSNLDTDAVDPGTSVPQSIVVVDDDDDLRAGLKAVFESWGHHAQGFGTLKAAFAYLSTLKEVAQPDFVLIDNWLPDGHGIDCVSEFRKQCPSASLVLLTGDSDNRTLARGRQFGLPVLVKPVTANKLAVMMRVHQALKRKTTHADSHL